MLSFEIWALETQAATVDATLAASDSVWEDDDNTPVDGVSVQGRLSAAGPSRFYFTGRLEGSVVQACRRCLVDTTVAVSDDVQLVFAEADLDEVDDADVVPVPPGARTLELAPAIREAWLLAVPAFATCRPDCRGLCPSCGADRNAGDCGCQVVTDSRWDALRTVRES